MKRPDFKRQPAYWVHANCTCYRLADGDSKATTEIRNWLVSSCSTVAKFTFGMLV